jgi:hypothetical protein
VIRGLGLDRHPELLPAYFGNFHRLLSRPDRGSGLVAAARRSSASHWRPRSGTRLWRVGQLGRNGCDRRDRRRFPRCHLPGQTTTRSLREPPIDQTCARATGTLRRRPLAPTAFRNRRHNPARITFRGHGA